MDPSVASPRRPSFFNYLLGLDRQYQYHLDDRVKEEILATCNRYLFSDDPLFLDLVGRPTEEPRRRLVVPPLYRDTADVYYPSSDEEGADGDDGPLGIEYSESRRGKPCGHVFFRGEGVYRCRNCSLDDTCVLCARCFQASDHTGHDTSFSVNSGTGGCCDCGDREAWDASVKCRYHSCEDGETPREAVELPTHAVAGFASTIKVALEFMLATFCLSPDPFKAVLDKESIVRDAYRASVPYAERPELNVYTTVLWNDDGHSFQEVTDQLTECLGISLERARAITDQTHVVGRSVILTSPDLATHLRVARHLSSIRLQVSIRSARDTFREQLCALLLGWLKDLSKVSSEKYQALNLHFEGTFNSTIKNCLCTLLTKPWELVGRNARLRNALLDDNAELTEIPVDPVACVSPEETLDPRELVWDGVPAASIPNCPVPVLNPNQWDPTGFTPATPVPLTPAAGSDSEGDPPSSPSVADDADLDAEDAVTDVSAPTTGNLFAHRLDWFLVYDMRLWHEVRTGLRELYMATLTLSTRHKRGIAASFATNYDRLSSSFLLRDKGPEHSIILFSVQLFTVPSIARTLTMRNGFLYTIIRILRQFFVKDTPPELLARGVISCDSQAFRNRRYFHVFHDMRYLTGTKTCVRAMRDDTQFLDLYLRFLRLFQGMDPIVRQMGNHVEYETDTWINAFNVTLQVAKSCRLLANCYFRRPRAFAHALRACLRLILHTALKGGEESGGTNLPEYPVDPTPYFRSITLRWGATYPVLSYSVSSGYVSFHHPLHWFLAQLLHRRQRLRRSALRAGGWDDFLALVWTFNCPGWDNGRPLGGDPDLVARLRRDPAQQRRLLLIFDYPIRVCCLMAQIRAYLWVRNGHLAKSSAAHYCEITLRNNTFDLDVFLIQTAFCLLEPDHILLTMLDRYEILDFFHGRAGPHPNYEPSHILQMVEQFLHLLIVCVSERAVPANLPTAEHTRRFIVHGTVTPVPYTDLMKQVPDRLTEATSYDQLIRTVTDFRTPAFSNDVGNYELKDEYVSDVDPYFAHYPRNRKVEAETRLRAHARAHAPPGTRHPDFFHTNLVRLPSGPYQSLGNLLHGPLACQIMFYAVHASAHGAGSTVYGNLLDYGIHLIYLAVRDTNNDYYQPEWGPDPTQATDAADGHPLSPGTGGIWVHAGALKFPLGPAALMEDGTGPHMTLLDLVLQCLTRAECQVWAGKLEFIVHQFRRCGSPAVRETVRHHLHYQLERNMQAKAAAEETERQAQEAKRQLARQKRQQMMASLVSAQQQFIANHSQLYEDLDPEAEVEGEASEGRRSRVEVTGPGADPHYEEQQGNYPKDEGEDEDESDDDDDDDDDDDEDQASVGTGNPDAPADERNHDNEEGEEEEDRDYTDGEDDEDYAYDE
ncbi:E3 ubiquitin-protein ligase ubr1, partial [Tieghemiomyces parasiticus]